MHRRGHALKLIIGMPCYGGQMMATCAMSLVNLANVLNPRRIPFQIAPTLTDSLVHRARNEIVAAFLATDATHLFFIDADIQFEPADVLAMLDAGKGVVVGACPKKSINWEQVRAAAAIGDPDLAAAGLESTIVRLDAGPIELDASGCFEVASGGTGFMLIERRVLERVIAHCGPGIEYTARGNRRHAVFDTEISDGKFWGEDVNFCRRVRASGERVWCYAPAQLAHVGAYVFRSRPLAKRA